MLAPCVIDVPFYILVLLDTEKASICEVESADIGYGRLKVQSGLQSMCKQTCKHFGALHIVYLNVFVDIW